MLPGKDRWPRGLTKLEEVIEQGLTPKRVKNLQMKSAKGDKYKLWVTLWQGHATLDVGLVSYLRSTLDNLRVALNSDEPLIDKMDLKIDSHGAFYATNFDSCLAKFMLLVKQGADDFCRDPDHDT